MKLGEWSMAACFIEFGPLVVTDAIKGNEIKAGMKSSDPLADLEVNCSGQVAERETENGKRNNPSGVDTCGPWQDMAMRFFCVEGRVTTTSLLIFHRDSWELSMASSSSSCSFTSGFFTSGSFTSRSYH